MSSIKLSQTLAGLAFLIFGVTAVEAGNFSVSPVRATLSASHSIDSLRVRNNSDESAVIQVEIAMWSQVDGSDVLQPSREILATPPIFTVPAKGTQVVRVGLRRAPDATRELAYRIFLQEVSPPPREGFQGLQVSLRLSIPVFVLPKSPVKPLLVWSAKAEEPGKIKLRISNVGNAHIQIANFTLSRAGNEVTPRQQVAAYVMPDQSKEWVVKADAPLGSKLNIAADTDSDYVRADVIVETR